MTQQVEKIVFPVGEMARLHILFFLEARLRLDMRKKLSLRLRSWDLVDYTQGASSEGK